MANKRKVILVTDGDKMARKAVEVAAKNIGGRCISCSWGNPTRLAGEQLVEEITSAAHDPVVVMLDDKGIQGEGAGEVALRYISKHSEIDVLGVVAVASNTEGVEGVSVDESVDNQGIIVQGPVDKNGFCCIDGSTELHGDTVEVLKELQIPVIVGVGDIGKMCGYDDVEYGAPITTKALQEVLKRSGYFGESFNK